MFLHFIDIVHVGLETLNMQPEHILCLGLGSPCESHQARFQLSFLLEMRDTITPVSSAAVLAPSRADVRPNSATLSYFHFMLTPIHIILIDAGAHISLRPGLLAR